MTNVVIAAACVVLLLFGAPAIQDSDGMTGRWLVIVYDREGYSPQFFAQMKEQRIAVLTYPCLHVRQIVLTHAEIAMRQQSILAIRIPQPLWTPLRLVDLY